jgi:hypothetical protein
MGRSVAILVVTLTVAALLEGTPAAAQGPTIAELKEFPDFARALLVAGYISGFAVAAQLPDDRAATLQRCFADWNNHQVTAILDSWVIRHSREVADPRYTARLAVFSALAEACGWKKRP